MVNYGRLTKNLPQSLIGFMKIINNKVKSKHENKRKTFWMSVSFLQEFCIAFSFLQYNKFFATFFSLVFQIEYKKQYVTKEGMSISQFMCMHSILLHFKGCNTRKNMCVGLLRPLKIFFWNGLPDNINMLLIFIQCSINSMFIDGLI